MWDKVQRKVLLTGIRRYASDIYLCNSLIDGFNQVVETGIHKVDAEHIGKLVTMAEEHGVTTVTMSHIFNTISEWRDVAHSAVQNAQTIANNRRQD